MTKDEEIRELKAKIENLTQKLVDKKTDSAIPEMDDVVKKITGDMKNIPSIQKLTDLVNQLKITADKLIQKSNA